MLQYSGAGFEQGQNRGEEVTRRFFQGRKITAD
jgi:hypothetical protein